MQRTQRARLASSGVLKTSSPLVLCFFVFVFLGACVGGAGEGGRQDEWFWRRVGPRVEKITKTAGFLFFLFLFFCGSPVFFVNGRSFSVASMPFAACVHLSTRPFNRS